MLITNEKLELDLSSHNLLDVPLEEIIFFDIETTGFSARSTVLYLIGVAFYENNTWNLKQWFSDNPQDEAIILADFFQFIQNYKMIVHYNGEGFDMPYLTNKLAKYNLPFTFENFISMDIFKQTRKIQKLLKLENYKQKTIEHFLEIERTDRYTGGELINVYNQYINSNGKDLLNLLLLHNKEDMIGMLQLLPILSYLQISEGRYHINSIETHSIEEYDGTFVKEAIFSGTLDYDLPKRVSYGNDLFYLTAYNHTIKIRMKIYTGELKYFYSNYKDYYYLPDEDTSIHKSIAFYVDKNYRTRAKAANCYSKKTGMFLPQISEIVIPYFKIDYNDKITYFELESGFLSNTNLQYTYIKDLLEKSI